MRVVINCCSFSKAHYTGIGRYTSNLVKSLTKIDRQNQYSLYTTRGFFNIRKRISLKGAGNFSIRWDWLKKGVDGILKEGDIYHAPSPEMITTRRAKVIVTVHDLIYQTYPQSHTRETVLSTGRQFESLIPSASKIICSSCNTLKDLHSYFSIDTAKTCCIYQGIDKENFYPMNDEEKESSRRVLASQGISGPYILFVGTIEPRKNLKGVFHALASLKKKKTFQGKLVVIGMPGWKSEGIKGLVEELDIQRDVIFLGFVTNEELCHFYNLAEVFVFPSFYEGFGYPILEALACGTAVVTSNVSSCPEIASDAALTVDPHDSERMAAAIAQLMQDRGLKERLRQKALERAREFDPLKTARETLRVYEEVHKLS